MIAYYTVERVYTTSSFPDELYVVKDVVSGVTPFQFNVYDMAQDLCYTLNRARNERNGTT